MKVAIIGAGNVGKALATSITRAGHEVTIAAKNPEHARAAAGEIGASSADSNAAAVVGADVVILAVPYAARRRRSPPRSVTRSPARRSSTSRTRITPDFSGLATTDSSAAEEFQQRLPDATSSRRSTRSSRRTRRTRPVRSTATSPATTEGEARGDLTRRVDGLHRARRRPAAARPATSRGWPIMNIGLNAQNGWSWTSPGSWSARPMPITRLNHAVLFVRDADAAAEFYRRAFGFEELSRPQGMRAVFMRSPTGGNHHDLGLFEVGAQALAPAARLGRALPPRLGDRHDRGPRRDGEVASPSSVR